MVENTFPHYPQILYKLRTDNCEKLTTIYRKHTFYPQLINKLWTILEFSYYFCKEKGYRLIAITSTFNKLIYSMRLILNLDVHLE